MDSESDYCVGEKRNQRTRRRGSALADETIRTGYRKYKIVAHEPIACFRINVPRDEIIAEAMRNWAVVLEEIVQRYWPQ
jgi:hypothetical protein